MSSSEIAEQPYVAAPAPSAGGAPKNWTQSQTQPRAAAAVNAASSSTCSFRCFIRGAIFSFVLLGSLFAVILLCRMAEISSTSQTGNAAFYNFNYWIVLISAPIASYVTFRRMHHPSVPWFSLCIACVAYLVLIQYTNVIGLQRQACTTIPDDNSVARRNCNIRNLGFTGAFFIFTSQLIAFTVATFSATTTIPTWDHVLCLFHSVLGTVFGRVDVPQLDHKWDLFFRIAQLVLAWLGSLFWLVEMAYFSNNSVTAATSAILPFSDWYSWVVVLASPILVAVSFQSQVPRWIPFLATICAFVLFYLTTVLTGGAAACVAFVNDNGNSGLQGVQLATCNFVFVGFVGLLLLWFGMLFFIGLAAIDVFSRAVEQAQDSPQAEDTRIVKMMRVFMVIIVLIGCGLWVILLGKTAQFISHSNANNPLCTNTSELECFYWYEWYWWQLLFICPVIAIFACLKTPRSAVPFYCSLLTAIMFFASQYYSQSKNNAVNGQEYILGIQGCRDPFLDTSQVPADTLRYCEMQAVGYTGILMMIVGLAMAVYLAGSRLPTIQSVGLASAV